jgi:DNA-binding NarL/FixJ family response regulator
VASIPALRAPILIADEDGQARVALAELLENEGHEVLQAANGDEAIDLARQKTPSVAILEVSLGRLSGYEVCRVLHEDFGTEFPVVFLSGNRTESYDRVAGLLLGGDDYVVKPYAPDELLARVRRLLQPQQALGHSTFGLTNREVEVLQLLAEGLTPAEIAERLFISRKTVGTHIEHVFRKLGVRSRSQAIAVAYRDGLVGAAR